MNFLNFKFFHNFFFNSWPLQLITLQQMLIDYEITEKIVSEC